MNAFAIFKHGFIDKHRIQVMNYFRQNYLHKRNMYFSILIHAKQKERISMKQNRQSICVCFDRLFLLFYQNELNLSK